ncbi:hypothetical protein KNU63_gp09 [Gordonia phage RogerDodger]|uniref:Uncharacterized protein n=1 Tax=Gordonia phage RogerDodger TaxID=2591116 RepID=A0A515MHE0_9CAUD|nr:hypothetical protein KNU63_gp09 [Gordonia phage RogerDodger]QDM56091.1 hypothetical protein SEA_ROGERDODGER_9 [Gordonia phage RogerDodger]
MTADMPTPSQIVDGVLDAMVTIYDVDAERIIAALSEHYHLLPRSELGEGGTFDAGCGATTEATDGDVRLRLGNGVSALRSPGKTRELASALTSAADVAEEPR